MSLIGDLLLKIGIDQTSYSDMRSQLAGGVADVQAFSTAVTAAGQAMDSGVTSSVDALKSSLAGLKESTATAGSGAGELANAEGAIAEKTQEAEGAIGRFRISMGGMSESFGEAKAAMLEFAEAYGLIKIGQFFMEQADQVEQATQRIVATTGAIGEQLQGLQEQFSGIFAQLPESAAEVAGAMGQIGTVLNDTGADLNNLTVAIGDISTVTGVSMQTLSTAVTQAFANWHVAVEDQVQELTNLQAVAQAANTPLTSLLSQLAQFGPVLRDMGLSLDDAAALFGNLDVQGFNASRVVMGLQTEMTKLAKEGVPDVTAAMADWVEKIKNAADKTDALKLASDAGGRSAAMLVDAIRSGAINFDDFTGKLKLTTASLADQAAAAETLGQAWSKALNALDADLGGAFEKITGFLKEVGNDIAKALGNPDAYITFFFDSFEIAFLRGEQRILQELADHPLLATLLLPTKTVDDINSQIGAISDHILKLSIDVAAAGTKIAEANIAFDSMQPHLKAAGDGFKGGADAATDFGNSLHIVFPKLAGDAKEVADAISKVPASYEDFARQVDSGELNPQKFENTLDQLVIKTKAWGEATGLNVDIIVSSLESASIQIAKFTAEYNFEHLDQLIQKMRDLGDSVNQAGKTAIASFDSMEQKLQTVPIAFDPLEAALKNMGLTVDGETKQAAADFAGFEEAVTSAAGTVGMVEAAFDKAHSALSKMVNDPEAMAKLLQMDQQHLTFLEQSDALTSEVDAAQVQYASDALKAAEAQGAGAQSVLLLGQALDTAKTKQDLFNESQTRLLDLEHQVGQVFSATWTEFGTQIGDAIAGTESFGQAWNRTISDMEKKLSELAVNFLLGQLKEAVLENGVVLEKYHQAWNDLFGISSTGGTGSSGASAIGSGIDALNQLPLGASGTVAGGASGTIQQGSSGIIGGLSQVTSIIGVLVSAIGDIVQGFQMAHLITVTERVELNTRQVAQAIDGEMLADVHNIEIYSQQTHDWLQDVLQQYMQNINIDLDTANGYLQVISTHGSAGGGPPTGGGGPDSNLGVTTITDVSGASSTLVANLADASSASVNYTAASMAASQAMNSNLSSAVNSASSDVSSLADAANMASGAVISMAGNLPNFTNIPPDPNAATDFGAAYWNGFQWVPDGRVAQGPPSGPTIPPGSLPNFTNIPPDPNAATDFGAAKWNGFSWVPDARLAKGPSVGPSVDPSQVPNFTNIPPDPNAATDFGAAYWNGFSWVPIGGTSKGAPFAAPLTIGPQNVPTVVNTNSPSLLPSNSPNSAIIVNLYGSVSSLDTANQFAAMMGTKLRSIAKF